MVLFDISDDQLEGARTAIERQLSTMEGEGLLWKGQTAAVLSEKVSFSTKLQDAAAGASYIQVATMTNFTIILLKCHKCYCIFTNLNIGFSLLPMKITA